MDKKILEDYIDACEFIKETEAEIKKLEKKKRFVQDKVRGSNPDWPYEEWSFSLGAVSYTHLDVYKRQTLHSATGKRSGRIGRH